jgi:hypothetical protein
LAGVPAPAKRETENEFFHVRWLPFCLFFFFFFPNNSFACSFSFCFASTCSLFLLFLVGLLFLLLPCREKKTE